MSSSGSCTCSYRPIITAKSNIVVNPLLIIHGNRRLKKRIPRICVVRASTVENSSSNFVQRIEKAWLISKQPRPIICSTCDSNGNVDCKWCGGTGFFILGDNMLCQVPSRNTSCVICAGKVTTLSRTYRVQYAAPTVKEQVTVQSGWESLLFPSLLLLRSNTSQLIS
ncbi:hypothetical protein CQW23_18951 [Capsicum baccatum]|uniref:Uncharacterized protein n=1 Tax=Capsicum baccatum TaxID=33114 RepID=A0A2G2W4D6_CAPBA|nr:hypothetical protein CQW23_18951 [Capsicum baccatum]